MKKLSNKEFNNVVQESVNSPPHKSKHIYAYDNSILLDIPHITNPVVDETTRAIKEQIGTEAPSALKCIFWSLYRCFLNDIGKNTKTFVAVSLRRDDYQGETRWNRTHHSYTGIKKSIELLVSAGLIILHKGWRNEFGSRSSRLEYTNLLKSHFLKNSYSPVFIPPNFPVKIKTNNGLKKPNNYIKFIKYCNKLDSINESLLQHSVKIQQPTQLYKVLPLTGLNPCNSAFSEGNSRQIQITEIYLTRVFNDVRMMTNGRFFCGLQCLKSDYRKYLLLDNQPVMEYDYSSTFVTMAYHLNGLELPSDPYVIENYTRHEAKFLLLIALNAKNKQGAIKAIMNKDEFEEDYDHYNDLLEKLEHKHAIIKNWFYSSAWKKLMKLESQIAEEIIEYFVSRNKPIIPIHDSFVVKQEDGQQLLNLMKSEWVKIFGREPKIKKK